MTHGTVAVWSISLDGRTPAPEADLVLLSADETQRAARFVFDADRWRWQRLHAAVRRILGAELGVSPESIQYAHGENGKPTLASPSGSGLEFNVSDSGDSALIALSLDGPVGVDVEHVHRTPDIHAIAERFFAREECDALRALPGEETVIAFYKCWTRKEAFVKALGAGLGHPLDRFAVSMDSGAARFLRRDPDAEGEIPWSLHSLALDGEYVGAVVVAHASPAIVLEHWTG